MKQKTLFYKKLFTLAILAVLAVMLFIPAASADAVTIYTSAYNNWSTSGSQLKQDHPSATSYKSGVSICFTAATSGYITSLNIYPMRVGAQTGTLTCTLQGVSGSVADDVATSNSTVFAQATNTLDIASITPASMYTTQTFQFNGTYQLISGKDYSICITATDLKYEQSSSYYVVFNCYSSDVLTSTMNFYHNDGWYTTTGSLGIAIYGSTTSLSPTPTPTPTATPVPTAAPSLWETAGLGSYLVLIAPLIMMLIPAFLAYKFAGAWGFWAGLNVGAILCYCILGASVFPLWGIVALLIVDGLLLFGKVGFHT